MILAPERFNPAPKSCRFFPVADNYVYQRLPRRFLSL